MGTVLHQKSPVISRYITCDNKAIQIVSMQYPFSIRIAEYQYCMLRTRAVTGRSPGNSLLGRPGGSRRSFGRSLQKLEVAQSSGLMIV